ncbi:dienelactone hydrolase-like protein [Gracilibacillus halophilus YIM-C55.5]|uniref:Dienelactone hydrolase-like protein n=1 Tax=Gracilibacillus halophilus YIM-C55.5 TaxID=1308866 RepID=N4WZA6_9BACI|nr:alpha/beta hydrolase family protein [Gracilibacillus halophilus]ENH98366.1 dienelactone hydrolase-like protein [Gracilibacillus halophilus YIM-C55.5]
MNQLDHLFDQFYQQAMEDSFQTAGPVERKYALKQRLFELLGDFSHLDEHIRPLEATIIESKDFPEYTREYVHLPLTELVEVNMYILTPKNQQKKHPAALALHGHGYGVKAIVGLTEDGEEDEENNDIHHHFAVQLAKRGIKVFAPEIIGFGKRRLSQDIENGHPKSCEQMASNLLVQGKTLAGLRIWEAKKLLGYIEQCQDVKTDRTGIMGFSGGALVAAYTAALDHRIQATVLTGFVNTFKGSILAMRHCLDNYIPGMLNVAEMPEWISLIAPRPLFIESGKDDHIFPVDTARQAIDELATYYENHAENFAYDIFDGGHEVNGNRSFDWLANKLEASITK